ncbi:YhgE/Pip domain-containing protein [Alkalicoccus chagannorensis]|uniref:YhgE/Pip domain-containing protein n=1 Tax=Alkalicoccus chagannorensis TaxID=427072 RepID=UPI000410ECC0|nr:YhgE/Pip domain-containing protein [Alkalicoccus chagannorensis]
MQQNITAIIKQDMKNIRRVPLIAVLLGGLAVLPALYAWLNLSAAWDPYDNTGDVPVAVVNEDDGVTVDDTYVSVGNEVEKALQENPDLGWTFVSRSEAEAGVESGDYYASVYLDRTFSQDMIETVEGELDEAVVQYEVNEKINAIAPTMTETGATTLTEQLNQTFVETAAAELLEEADALGLQLEERLPQAEETAQLVYDVEAMMPELQEAGDAVLSLEDAWEDVEDAAAAFRDLEEASGAEAVLLEALEEAGAASVQVEEALEEAGEVQERAAAAENSITSLREEGLIPDELETTAGDEALHDAEQQLEETAVRLEQLEADAAAEVLSAEEAAAEAAAVRQEALHTQWQTARTSVQEDTEDARETAEAALPAVERVEEGIGRELEAGTLLRTVVAAPDAVEEAESTWQEAETELLEAAEEAAPAEVLGDAWEPVGTELRQTLDDADDVLRQARHVQREAASAVEGAEADAVTMLGQLESGLETVGDRAAALDAWGQEELPALQQQLYSLHTAVETGADEAEAAYQHVTALLDTYEEPAGEVVSRGAAFARDELPGLEREVTEAAGQLRRAEAEGTLEEAVRTLRQERADEADRLAQPVSLTENTLYPIPNYGSANAPFYTALSLWVGGLLLVNLISTSLLGSDADPRFRERDVYLGRIAIFWIVALLQGLVVSLGNLFFLDMYAAHSVMFVLFSMLIGLVFMTMIYTLASMLGNIGKALAIVLLVLQLSAGGGTFPIEVTPAFYQAVHPYLPFTYAVDLLREAVGGLHMPTVLLSTGVLLFVWMLTLGIGLLLKPKLAPRIAETAAKSKSSRLVE